MLEGKIAMFPLQPLGALWESACFRGGEKWETLSVDSKTDSIEVRGPQYQFGGGKKGGM